MKALRWYGRLDLRYEDVPEPNPGPGQVKVRVHLTGICGSDLHEYQDGPLFISKKPHPLTGRMAPSIIGHEFCGRIVELSDEVTNFHLGDRVTGDCYWLCGKCAYCLKGMPNLCVQAASTGFHAYGSMAEYLVVPAYSLYKVPDLISDENAILTEPLAVGIHAVRKSRLQEGDTVAIIGAGTIGMSVLLAARAAGVSSVYVLEMSKSRRAKALAMGATEVFHPKESDAVDNVRKRTECLGVDVSFDCAGVPDSAPLAIAIARKGGTVVIVGMCWQPSPDFSFISIQLTEKTVVGSTGYVQDSNTAIKLMADDRINPDGLITGRVRLQDAVDKGFQELTKNPDKHLKILLEP